LEGFKVGHSVNDFAEGESVILTIKDSRIISRGEDGRYEENEGNCRAFVGLMAAEEDELENVVLAEKRKREFVKEATKRKLGYDATDAAEFENGGAKDYLTQYDESVMKKDVAPTPPPAELMGQSFKLNARGGIDGDDRERELAEVRAKMGDDKAAVSLSMDSGGGGGGGRLGGEDGGKKWV
jgi:hypothetical protein